MNKYSQFDTIPAMQIIKYVLVTFIAVAAVIIIHNIINSLPHQERGSTVDQRSAELISVPSIGIKDTLYWQACHETGDLEEYSWWHIEGVPTGTLKIIPDPTGSGRGSVLRGEITAAALPGGDSHRIYPALLLPECYHGGYRSSFKVWADLPPSSERGWISFATYSNKKDWKDLFGINLGFEQGEDRLVLFHVPVFSKGTYL
jgi:hypothetical protein